MSDTATTQLREPEQMDWNNYHTGSTYQAPPPALGPDGKAIIYHGQLPASYEAGVSDDGLKTFLWDNIKCVRSGNGADGYTFRFTRVSVKKFVKNGKTLNASTAGNLIKSAGIQAKPQTNAEYEQAMKQAANKLVHFTIDWEAKGKDTGEKIKGYLAFPPLDPMNPSGPRQSILRQGDYYFVLDDKGQLQPDGTGGYQRAQVKSEIIFANARVRFFQDPNRK